MSDSNNSAWIVLAVFYYTLLILVTLLFTLVRLRIILGPDSDLLPQLLLPKDKEHDSRATSVS